MLSLIRNKVIVLILFTVCISLVSFSPIAKHGNMKFMVESALQIPSSEGFSRIFEDSVFLSINNNGLMKINKVLFVESLDSFFKFNKPYKLELLSDQNFDFNKRNLKWMYFSDHNKMFKINIDAKLDEHDDHYHAEMISIELASY